MDFDIAFSKCAWTPLKSIAGPLLERVGQESSYDLTSMEAWPWNDRHYQNQEQDGNAVYAIKAKEINPIDVRLCSKEITLLSPNIGALGRLPQNVYLCCNSLKRLPDEIGHLTNLRVLYLDRNNLKTLPESIGMLKQLEELHLDFNRLEKLPDSLQNLKQLRTLNVSYNALTHFPDSIGMLTQLQNLDVSANPMKYLPAEITKLPLLRRFHAHECRFPFSLPHQPPAKNVPTLKELAARQIYRSYTKIKGDLPCLVKELVTNYNTCSFCGGPFDKYTVYRYSWWKKNDRYYPIYHRLCWNHWSNEFDRIKRLFEEKPEQGILDNSNKTVIAGDENVVIDLRKGVDCGSARKLKLPMMASNLKQSWTTSLKYTVKNSLFHKINIKW